MQPVNTETPYDESMMLSITRPTYRSRRGIPLSNDGGLSSLEEFLRMANHELRSPLTAVRVQSQLGRRYLERGDVRRVDASLRTIEEQSFHMERMLKDLLDAAKISQGHFTVRPVQANLVRLCKQCISMQRAITGRDIKTQLPETPVAILADPDALQRMFGYLLLNAALYSPANSPIEVTLALDTVDHKDRSQQALVSVRDEGSGIATEELTTIFEQFYRGNAGREAETSGLGLGLAICKEIVHLHGGEIWVISQYPGGSTFFVMLPVDGTR